MSILSFFLPASMRPPAKYPTVKPPKKASALLTLAADCLSEAMETGLYEYSSDYWHYQIAEGERTIIDLSGAIMAMRLGARPGECHRPQDYGWRWERRFKALNHLQRGMTRLASLQWDACHVPGVGEEDPPRFQDGPQEFYRFLRSYAHEFFRHRK